MLLVTRRFAQEADHSRKVPLIKTEYIENRKDGPSRNPYKHIFEAMWSESRISIVCLVRLNNVRSCANIASEKS